MKTTTITVNRERWDVPRGFGQAYLREAHRQLELIRVGKPGEVISVVIDLLSLVGWEPTREAVADWSLRKRVEAVVYAATVHLRAGDNPVQRHPELSWLPKPWQGKPRNLDHIRPSLRGAFDGPAPTELTT